MLVSNDERRSHVPAHSRRSQVQLRRFNLPRHPSRTRSKASAAPAATPSTTMSMLVDMVEPAQLCTKLSSRSFLHRRAESTTRYRTTTRALREALVQKLFPSCSAMRTDTEIAAQLPVFRSPAVPRALSTAPGPVSVRRCQRMAMGGSSCYPFDTPNIYIIELVMCASSAKAAERRKSEGCPTFGGKFHL